MNQRIFFYPSSYTPTPKECRIIKTFIEAGFAPSIDAVKQPTGIEDCKGLYWNIDSEEIRYCDEFKGENIFFLVLYLKDDDVNLESSKAYFSGLLGLCTFARKGKKLFDDFKPKPIQKCLSGTKFEEPTEFLNDGRSVTRIEGGSNQSSVDLLIIELRGR